MIVHKPHWEVRAANGGDLSFIYSTWMNSYWSDSEGYHGIKGEIFFKDYPLIIDEILSKAKIAIACLPDAPAVILGYLVAEPPIAHYSFVKSNFRQFGIFKSLVNHLEIKDTFTHRTGMLSRILKYHKNYNYNPYLLMKRGDTNEQSHSEDRSVL